VKLRPDHKLVFQRAWDDPAARLKGVTEMMETIAGLVTT